MSKHILSKKYCIPDWKYIGKGRFELYFLKWNISISFQKAIPTNEEDKQRYIKSGWL